MGCVQTKTNSPSYGSNGLDRLKSDHGYVKGGGEGRHVGPKAVGKEEEAVKINVEVNADTMKQNEGDVEDDEVVDGWPKWLVENVPSEVLDGLVPKSAESYDKLAKIGQGTYSNVYKARDRDTKKIVALKKVRFDTSEPESIKFMAREITILRKLDHPNIIKLEGLATSRMQYSLYLVFEFMQHDLTKIISRPDERLTEPQVKCYMRQLLSGLEHCHDKGILHRDIKPSNLLIDENGTLKIADFGLANFFPPKQKRALTSRVVTLWYRAPELLLGSTDYGASIDLWSAGCLLVEMFVGRPVLPGRTEVEQLHRIFKLCGSPLDDYWKKMKLPTSFRPPHHYKPSFEEFFLDFSTPSYRLLTTLLTLDPTSRGTAASGLQSAFFSSSPLACGLSALPVLYKEDNLAETKDHKRRVYKVRQWSQTNSDFHLREVQVREFESFNEEKNAEARITHNQELGSIHSQDVSNTNASSSSITSSQFGPSIHKNLNTTLYPARTNFHHQIFPSSTEAHPNALKNINPHVLYNLKNFTLLHASIKDIVPTEGSTHRRSQSTLEFRNFDPEKIYRFDKGVYPSWDINL